MPVDQRALLADLQRQVRLLEDDVRDRAAADAEVTARLQREHAEARRVGRTATSFGEFRDGQVTQAAVAWVLATVFVRFCEDNRLVDDAWISGPGDRLREAGERQTHWFSQHPADNDRDWLLQGFAHLAGLPALAPLFDERHNPLFRLDVSADAAEALLRFWRERDGDGALVHDFTDPSLDTRFLGDLYQDLSEAARKQFALLQTPEFVEDFILGLTLDPAIDTFGLEGLRMIDPTCGSGHFLLGAFDRLFQAWSRERPSLPTRERVRLALDSVHGVDVNPFATAIARFRLTVAALRAEGITRLRDAPGHPMHLGTGDSLLHGKSDLADGQLDLGLGDHSFASEDLFEHPDMLKAGTYHAVVGNPPYITVKDSALNEAYRQIYKSCGGTYALSVPFAERFFELAVMDVERPGFVGQITSNSFMKREFGKKLVTEFLPRHELTHVIDTSGAYIPGHGTPTVILIGRRRFPRRDAIKAVLGVRGEPSAPADPAQGLVWTEMVSRLAETDYDGDYISVRDLQREVLNVHPWSLSGGGAAELVTALEQDSPRLRSVIAPPIGGAIRAGADEAFMRLSGSRPGKAPAALLKGLLTGDVVRDWQANLAETIWYPYTEEQPDARVADELWPWRSVLAARRTFQGTMEEAGLRWFEYMQHTKTPYRTPLSITFAFVATHNHFVLDRGGKVFNRSAPVIKLPEGATEDDHLALLGVLNSSTACFWLKQVSHNKGSTVDQRGARQATIDWENFYEFTGTKLQELPLPASLSAERARQLQVRVERAAQSTPAALVAEGVVDRASLASSRETHEQRRAHCIGTQEELDWEVYRAYGLVDEDLFVPVGSEPEVRLGERAFEIVLARKAARGEADTVWFERHRSTPITEVPEHWPADYRALVERRIALIESDKQLALVERPDCKRRWASDPWETQQERALRGWLLDRLEEPSLWRQGRGPATQSVAQLASRLADDATFLEVLETWAGKAVTDPAKELARLLADEHVPYLAALRYKAPGLRKRAEWEETWALQRREDAGEPVEVPVPPKYTSADFLKASYWKHRGKLDVPKERFVSYPGAEKGADTSLVLGWAGWDHAEQAQALAILVGDRQSREGWPAERLTPLLAGLAELEPWLHQWHAEPVPGAPQGPAGAITGMLEQRLGQLGLPREDLATWRPPAPTRGRRARS
ncbi:BREX-2 system adenine-specific DNA-methyltransferase PglX [Nocardioides sp. GY 10127]|uniref:BREX-2 system adenine-specific DNA-methyltransferase PglX n=1 Tax=Nocardioides sp. GY 10127 TaxID=2569762 RepID=UPI0010A79087|nr:BREX-2 system adenine-specific DNA-methyltransferase PglX [Nocardioides sp. GY 10127]TIC84439.1 BREX-2 system adenine-specific DNA-methyltransferase PglX [Nocardioides sp. GY 10127]